MAALGIERRSLDEVARSADVVTLHVPDGDETHHVIGEAFLASMQPSAYLINTSGGSVVDPDALAAALEVRQIAGAALDVFEGHPLPASSPLMNAPNVILTPHIGGATDETIERHSTMIADEIERFIDGDPLERLVNPEYTNHVR